MLEVTAPVKTTAFTVALIGNPNVGKTTIFNRLTGLRQKVGNYAGVTVDKRSGKVQYIPEKVTLVDLPGTYSIHPNTENEIIVHRVLNGLDKQSKPDYVLAILDMSNLERGLFLVTQVMDLGLPMAVILNMEDTAKSQGFVVKTHQLYKALGVPLIETNARSDKGMEQIEGLISQQLFETPKPFLARDEFNPPTQREEIQQRYEKIREILEHSVEQKDLKTKALTDRLDKIFLHKTWGYLFFLSILLLIFQAIYAWSTVPMDLIDGFFCSA